MRSGVIFIVVALAAVAGGAWWVLGSRPIPAHERGAAVPSGDSSGMHAIPEAITRRDPSLDRDLTASADAFRQYAEGTALWASRPADAAALLQNATRLDPSFAPAHYRLAWTAVLLSSESMARTAIRAAVDAGARLPEPYRTTAGPLSRFLEGSFDIASMQMRDALQAEPDDADAHLLAGLLAGCSCDHFDPEAAASHLEAALRAEPGITLARSMLIDLDGALGRPARAIERARAVLDRHPDSAGAHAEMGRAQVWAGDLPGALASADEALRRGGDALADGLGPAFVLHGDHKDLRALDDSEMDPQRTIEGNIRAHLSGGINDVWEGRFAEAAQRFERGAEYARAPWRRAEAARFFLLLGRVRSLAGRHAEATVALQAAQRVGGNQAILEYALGMNALAAGQAEESSRSAYRLGHGVRPDQPGWNEPWRLLLEGEMALAKGEAASAASIIAQAVSLASAHPQDCIAGDVEAYYLDAAGRAALAAGRPQEALEAFDRIRALGARAFHQPEIAVMAMYRSARALQDLGRTAEAAERYRRFLDRWGAADAPLEEARDAAARVAGSPGA